MNRDQIRNILENRVLPLVQRPGRYIGGEVNSVSKDLDKIKVRTALVFPDVYEVGMSNLGLKILYDEVNSSDDFYAERVFSPWMDMEKYMRLYNIPTFSLETHSSLTEFDIVGFSLQYELCYSNVLTILDLAGIPFKAQERQDWEYPLIIAGGLVAYTPEPISQFIDFFIVGDGEEIFIKVLKFYNEYKNKLSKKDFLKKIAISVDCIYVPSLYDAEKDDRGRLVKIKPCSKEIPEKVKKHVINSLDICKIPQKPVVPLIEIVHDRAAIEIMRGCPRACRFCQAGVLYKPVRKRSTGDILEGACNCIKNTGYGELGLLSLSSTDFGGIDELAGKLLKTLEGHRVSMSLPSMRIDSFSLELMDKISKVKKTGITLAPEAASEKLLKVINKGYKPQDVVDIAGKAHGLGYRVIKLYFMIGLPGEDNNDLDELVNLLYKVNKIGFLQVNVSISTLIPKPYTPFQWMDMTDIETIKMKQEYLRSRVRKSRIKLKFHNYYVSILEAVFGRGDRRLGDVIYKAWQLGARFDQWEECFKYDTWEKAFLECGIDLNDYLKGWRYDSALPWDHIDIGFDKEYFVKECNSAGAIYI